MNEEMNNKDLNFNAEKKNNGTTVLLVILIVLVLCLIGLTCYKMLIYDKKNNNNVVENNDNNKKTDEKDYTNNFPSSNDKTFDKIGNMISLLSKEEIASNFKNLEKNFNGTKVIFNCIDYGPSPSDGVTDVCFSAEVVYNNLKLELSVIRTGSSWPELLYNNDNYYVLIGTGGVMTDHTIYVYNKNGEIITNVDSVLYDVSDVKNDILSEEFKYIKLANNKVYFKKKNDTSKYFIIDLSSNEEVAKIIKEY